MSAYPSSATLAAFREGIAWRARRPDQTSQRFALVHPIAGGAWPDELQHGVGYRYRNDPTPTTNVLGARQDASAMRSRAYAARPLAVRYCTPFDCAHRTHYQPTIDGPVWS